MRHDPERAAALFLGAALSESEREKFTTHLLRCADCWGEVDQARRGRSLAESTRTAAPASLRDQVRGLVDAEPREEEPRPRRSAYRLLVGAGVSLAAAVVIAQVLSLGGETIEPPSLRQAVADFTAHKLPGAQLPDERQPDLSALDLQPVGAGGGSYAGLEVDGYAYRDPAGRRVVLYISEQPFPEAPGAQRLAGADGPWIVQRGDVIVLCARLPHALLVVGQDDALVRSTASALGVL
jgi:hypothetical protein